MYIQTLKNIIVTNHFSRADIAKLAHVSRAAVTKWFKAPHPEGWVNVESKTLIHLANGLQVSPDLFLKPRPLLNPLATQFLWDSLYSDMESFVHALIYKQKEALARLVQVVGFTNAKFILGQAVVDQFPHYAHYIKPARRKELEILWPLYRSKI